MACSLNQTAELRHELAVAWRDLLEDRFVNLIELAHRNGFRIKVGHPRSQMVIVSPDNIHFISKAIH